jgi:hypothetical protein
MMEERYRATIQNLFYPDMSSVNKNITVEAKLNIPPTCFSIYYDDQNCWYRNEHRPLHLQMTSLQTLILTPSTEIGIRPR